MADHISETTNQILPNEKVDVVAYGCTSGTIEIGEEKIKSEIHKSKVDALITESGLASDIHDMIHIPDIDQSNLWNNISEMIMNERYYDRLSEAEQIEEILQEANAYGLRKEVIEWARKFIKRDPKLDRVSAFQMSYDEWVK